MSDIKDIVAVTNLNIKKYYRFHINVNLKLTKYIYFFNSL